MIDLQMTILAYLVSNGIASLVGLFLGWGDVYKLKFRSKKVVKEIISFGKFSVGTNLSATLLGSVDTYIINFMLGPTALAVFNTGIRLLQVVEIPLLSFASTAMPTLSTLYNQGNQEELVKVAKKYIAIVTILFIPMIVLSFLFGDLAVWILAGSKYVYTEAPNLLRLFMILSLLYPLDRFLALMVDVIHKPQVNLLKVLCMLAINIVVDVVCIYYFKSIYCVVFGAILALLTAIAISYHTLKKYYIRISLIDIYKQLSFTTIKSFIFNNGK
ncbi:hypothetical protein GCM10023231_03190 [Olivibacter ginsenosidimutans]|uniref:Oligosaccharide flippase family protein n=2 Tax=Olivibacter ginsenosidimutans TaxID=1176537 RepID=A0ABP9AEL1_9SPHI